MGVNYGQRRPRLHDLANPTEIVETTIGEKELKMEHWDEQLIYDKINAELDKQEDKLKKKTEFFER